MKGDEMLSFFDKQEGKRIIISSTCIITGAFLMRGYPAAGGIVLVIGLIVFLAPIVAMFISSFLKK